MEAIAGVGARFTGSAHGVCSGAAGSESACSEADLTNVTGAADDEEAAMAHANVKILFTFENTELILT